MRLYYAILILFILFYNSYCSISQEIVTDRPDQTESPSIVPKSSLQIETGFSVQYAENYSLSKRPNYCQVLYSDMVYLIILNLD